MDHKASHPSPQAPSAPVEEENAYQIPRLHGRLSPSPLPASSNWSQTPLQLNSNSNQTPLPLSSSLSQISRLHPYRLVRTPKIASSLRLLRSLAPLGWLEYGLVHQLIHLHYEGQNPHKNQAGKETEKTYRHLIYSLSPRRI
jgi:hypothetical protein